jgi:hypothetical protein
VFQKGAGVSSGSRANAGDGVWIPTRPLTPFAMAVLAPAKVFEADDVERIKDNGVAALVGNDNRPRGEKNKIGVRDGIFVSARRDQCEGTELFNARPDGFNVHGATVVITRGFVKRTTGGAGSGLVREFMGNENFPNEQLRTTLDSVKNMKI